ncbi:MAG: hypothetical protein LBU76_09205 [Azoarcus sp.]|nr:hypothetical protein [Azoarcus sp.]
MTQISVGIAVDLAKPTMASTRNAAMASVLPSLPASSACALPSVPAGRNSQLRVAGRQDTWPANRPGPPAYRRATRFLTVSAESFSDFQRSTR